MRHKLFLGIMPVAAIVASGLLASASSAPAQNQCAARNDIIRQLDTQYGEKPAAIGQVDQQSVIEVYVSDQGTWTIIVSGTDGGSCILASGEGWDSNSTMAAAMLRGA
jgi:hypothetical protein